MSEKWIFLVEKGLSTWRVKSNQVTFIMMLLLATSIFINPVAIAAADGSGKIVGTVTDEATGEPLLGVTVSLSGTLLGAVTDLDGYYRIKNVPVGTYDIVASCVGYDKAEVSGVGVTDNGVATIELSIKEQLVEMEGITVRSKAVHNTEVSTLAKRQKATAISDAISSEQISRSGSGNAAETMTKVTGATVLGGKHVYIRGLGDRYTNTHLNGSPLPSPDPEKQSMPMDMIPTGMLDNIVVEKSFTPDKPGNFAGGSVNMNTKDYPERRELKISTSTSYNSLTTNNDMLTQPISGKDWLGYDDGKRQVPAITDSLSSVPAPPGRVKPGENIDSVMQLVEYYDRAYDSFDPVLTPRVRKAPPNQSHSLSYGDVWSLFDKPFGVITSLSYSKSSKYYEDGFYGRYEVEGEVDGSVAEDPWTRTYAATDSKGTEEVLWGGMAVLKYGIHPNHKLGFNYAYTRNGIAASRQLEGPSSNEYVDTDGDFLRNFALVYTERKLWSAQFTGEHVFGSLGLPFKNIRANWQISQAKTNQEDPDTRYLTDERQVDEILGNDTVYQYQLEINRYSGPVRHWRDFDEENREYKLDLQLPFSKGKFKAGAAYLKKERTYRDLEYYYGNTTNYGNYEGDIDAWAGDLGFDSMYTYPGGTRLVYTNALSRLEQDRNQYEGEQEIYAFYGMFDYILSSKWSIIGGLRYETTKMHGATHDTVATKIGDIDGSDLLPSINLIYKPGKDVNLRLAFGRTLARPTIREMIPAPSEEFGLSRYFFGNADIKYTKINNIETRLEWFMRPGEVASVSVFYKDITDPIEMVIVSNKGELIPDNTDKAKVYGIEFEFRRRLDHTGVGFLQNLSIGGNLTLVKSKVDIPEIELEKARLFDDDPDTERPMHGQSPYIINVDLGYNNFKTGTTASIFYNVFGRRLTFNARGATPDVYEEPRNQLDFLFTQKLFFGSKLKFSVKNILDADVKMVHKKLGLPGEEERVYRQYNTGRTYSIGMTYDVL